MTATEHVLDTLIECERAGVKLATVLASGFSEAGPHGVAREQAVREFARGILTPYKVPRRIYVVDELPRSLIGKVMRRQVRESLLALTTAS